MELELLHKHKEPTTSDLMSHTFCDNNETESFQGVIGRVMLINDLINGNYYTVNKSKVACIYF